VREAEAGEEERGKERGGTAIDFGVGRRNAVKDFGRKMIRAQQQKSFDGKY